MLPSHLKSFTSCILLLLMVGNYVHGGGVIISDLKFVLTKAPGQVKPFNLAHFPA